MWQSTCLLHTHIVVTGGVKSDKSDVIGSYPFYSMIPKQVKSQGFGLIHRKAPNLHVKFCYRCKKSYTGRYSNADLV